VTKRRCCFDIETNGFLDDSSVDYAASPWKLRDSFVVHCIVVIDMDTKEEFSFVQEDCYTKFPTWAKDNVGTIVGHNIINFDLLVCKVALGMDYTVGPDTWQGGSVDIIDTLVLSKTLNPDRRGHSIEYFGELLGYPKIDWRAKAVEIGLIDFKAAKGEEFKVYNPEMLTYNVRDVEVNIKTYEYLLKEWGDWKWDDAYQLEKSVAEIITRQSHRGFWFDSDLALANVKELDILMEERRAIVEPNLPPKPMGKTKLKEYIPGLKQFKMDGEPNANIIKWCERHGGVIEKVEGGYSTVLYGKTYVLPIGQEPIVSTEPASLDDITFIKEWLVRDMKWRVRNYKERDLTVDSKKQKYTQAAFAAVVERYVEQTLSSPFCADRCEHLEVSPQRLKEKLLKHDMKRPLKVLTNPILTEGQEKEICPSLLEIAEQFPHARLVVDYLTYKHRRNSILGGGFDPDDWDEDDVVTGKGFLANVRSDGRIPTPADTCGAGSSRFKHKLVANIARVTSLYGHNMRGMFGVNKADGFLQLGYDFDSLEAMIEASHCFPYPGGPEYGVSLTAAKPNDCHSVLAKSISTLINKAFPRGTAKSVKYGCSYNAQAKRVAKIVGCDLQTAQVIFDAFWEYAEPLKLLKERMQAFWETVGKKAWLLGLDNRKLPIRSKGNVVNSRFQSSGVICAKRAMVLHDKKLRAEGLTVDFWKDDWKNKSFCQQLMAYHDEAQLEVKRDMVEFKTFPLSQYESEEAAEVACKLFKKEHPDWSDIGHTDKMYFVAYCRAGVLATESVREAGEYYKLNVPLSAGYILGTTWASCH